MNRIWQTLDTTDHLLAIASKAINIHRMNEVATRHGCDWSSDPDDEVIDFFIRVPTEKLTEVLYNLKNEGIGHGCVDCCNKAAVAICEAIDGLEYADLSDGNEVEDEE